MTAILNHNESQWGIKVRKLASYWNQQKNKLTACCANKDPNQPQTPHVSHLEVKVKEFINVKRRGENRMSMLPAYQMEGLYVALNILQLDVLLAT